VWNGVFAIAAPDRLRGGSIHVQGRWLPTSSGPNNDQVINLNTEFQRPHDLGGPGRPPSSPTLRAGC
jgi:hypothetical protein